MGSDLPDRGTNRSTLPIRREQSSRHRFAELSEFETDVRRDGARAGGVTDPGYDAALRRAARICAPT